MAQSIQSPDEIYGQLFRDVELHRIFDDSKTFVDCIPKRDPKLILDDYKRSKDDPTARFSLKVFVEQNFIIPQHHPSKYKTTEKDIVKHITNLWTVLSRKSDTTIQGSSLLPLPHEYIVPGGRFREIYYWDSYFTMLGLKESKLYDLMENMVRNFAFLIDTYGHMPNGNRTYYLSRSQPPVLSLMVDLLAEVKGNQVYKQYYKVIEKEYNYWMDKDPSTKHVVTLPDRSILNRYYDQLMAPRPESYAEDMTTAAIIDHQKQPALFRDIRSAAESGWDFSSRWFKDSKKMFTIQTTSLIPIDLNCLLYHMELTLSNIYKDIDPKKSEDFKSKAELRKNAILKYCWSENDNWYVDYNIETKLPSTELTIAGMFPFFLNLADKEKAKHAEIIIQEKFLQAGGLVTTMERTGQQWDSPNGWAPMQWISIIGLENYGLDTLAKEIAMRWISLNKKIFEETGKLEEKYDVVDADKHGTGGEYPSQDGFGWTNGVLLALINKYDHK
jgi:alpha,alpha-trehalase